LAAELEERRGAPVRLQALTGEPPPVDGLRPAGSPGVLLVPLLLLPGSHARMDVSAIAAHWRRSGGLKRLPLLGAWPAWQQALAHELAAMEGSGQPVLLHHPLEGPLAARYLRLLEQRCGCRCVPAPYSAADPADPALSSLLAGDAAVLPLALAANRLCERLGLPALLERPRLRQALLRQLEALP
jgi:sirohydrochlorin ferrochelatase